jgi:hypothetical protein
MSLLRMSLRRLALTLVSCGHLGSGASSACHKLFSAHDDEIEVSPSLLLLAYFDDVGRPPGFGTPETQLQPQPA